MMKEKLRVNGKMRLLDFAQLNQILSGRLISPTLNLREGLSTWQQSLMCIQEKLSVGAF